MRNLAFTFSLLSITAFGLAGRKALYRSEDGVAWLEATAADSNVMVLRHERSSGRFTAMSANGRGHSLSFHSTKNGTKGEHVVVVHRVIVVK